jgi:hypothetical protein
MYRINNAKSKRTIDENGFLYARDCPILRDGVMTYLGGEINTGEDLDPKKSYRLNISLEELKRSLDKWKLKPIVNDHKWLGATGNKNAKDYQEGSIGEELRIEKKEDGYNYILANLIFTNLDTVGEIQEGKKQELSTSYLFEMEKSQSLEYDYEVIDLIPNHLALVEKGRAGERVRVENTGGLNKENTKTNEDLYALDNNAFNNITNNEGNKKMLKNSKITVDGVETPYNEFVKVYNEELKEDGKKEKEEDNKEKSATNEDENKTPEDNKDKKEVANEDKDEKKKKDVENEDDDEVKDKKTKAENYDVIYNRAYNTIKSKMEAEQKEVLRVYNSVKEITGDFNFYGLNKKDLLLRGLNHAGIQAEGNESERELEAMFKVCVAKEKVDNSFSYTTNGKDETDFNF